ncbi:MAG: DUF4900 domain-containing protein [Firmicutes bacterium]|nr:DUF4900 domain-containing protein [Bacillota bacterium]
MRGRAWWWRDQEGGALVVAVAALALLSTLGLMLVSAALAEARISDQHMRAVQAFAAADGGASEAISELDFRVKNFMPARVSKETQMQDVWAKGYADLLADYAYPPGGTPFTRVDSQRCRLDLHRDLETGSYDAVIEVWGIDRGWEVTVDEEYMWFDFGFSIESTGWSGDASRTVRTEGTFRLHVSRLNFARFALFTDVHESPGYAGGGTVWFTNRTAFTGWVHTNDHFSIYRNPRFVRGPLTQAERNVNFWSAGLQDAYECPPDKPELVDGARFYRGAEDGISKMEMPTSAYSQLRAAAGLDLTILDPPTNRELRQALGLPDSDSPLSTDIYLAHPEAQNRVTGGVLVVGDAWYLHFSVDGGNRAVYELRTRAGAVKVGSSWVPRTATITVDRENDRTTVVWSPFDPDRDPAERGKSSATQVFAGVPNGVIYVQGKIGDRDVLTGIRGQLGEQERVTVVAERTVFISGNLRYQSPPAGTPDAPNESDKPNMLGIYCVGRDGTPGIDNDVRIHSRLPEGDLTVHAVVMTPRGVYMVDRYSEIPPKGFVHHLGGVISKWYGPFGQFNPSTGQALHGYGRDFQFDYRVERMAPPAFPTTGRLVSYTEGGLKIWREELK